MFFRRFKPARQEIPSDIKMIVDLDRLISEPVGFRFRGRVHQIKPLTNAQFFRVINDFTQLQWLAKQEKVDHQQVIGGYAKIFQTCCPTISNNDVASMTPSQMAALFQQIHDIVTGKAFSPDEEKKTLAPTGAA